MVTIIEAIEATTPAKPYITRESWIYPTPEPVAAPVMLIPTDSPDGFVVHSWMSGHRRSLPLWNPSRADILADDWVPVG